MKTYTTAEAAAELGVCPSRIRQMMSEPRYAGIVTRRGRDWIFSESDLKKLREKRES